MFFFVDEKTFLFVSSMKYPFFFFFYKTLGIYIFVKIYKMLGRLYFSMDYLMGISEKFQIYTSSLHPPEVTTKGGSFVDLIWENNILFICCDKIL